HPSPTHNYTLSLHDALPILLVAVNKPWQKNALVDNGSAVTTPRNNVQETNEQPANNPQPDIETARPKENARVQPSSIDNANRQRSEEHTSELQSRSDLVCRL